MNNKRKLMAGMLADFNKIVLTTVVIGPFLDKGHSTPFIIGIVVIIVVSTIAWFVEPKEKSLWK